MNSSQKELSSRSWAKTRHALQGAAGGSRGQQGAAGGSRGQQNAAVRDTTSYILQYRHTAAVIRLGSNIFQISNI